MGSLTLTYGIGELMDRALYHITDSVEGTVKNKSDIIKDTIDNMDTDISRMQDRIDQKMAMMERQFITMETALSKLQSQSGWLTSQLKSLGY